MTSNFKLTDVMQVQASIDQVRSFITDPERIADYFPNVQSYGEFVPNESLWFVDKFAATLLEYPPELRTDKKIVMQVTTNNNKSSARSPDEIKAAPLLSLTEDWELEETDNGTQITKIWHSVELHKMKWFPMGWLIRRTAKTEHDILINAWNAAALRKN